MAQAGCWHARAVGVCLMLSMHAAHACTMRIGYFPALMAAPLLGVLPPNVWRRLAPWAERAGGAAARAARRGGAWVGLCAGGAEPAEKAVATDEAAAVAEAAAEEEEARGGAAAWARALLRGAPALALASYLSLLTAGLLVNGGPQYIPLKLLRLHGHWNMCDARHPCYSPLPLLQPLASAAPPSPCFQSRYQVRGALRTRPAARARHR